MIRKRLAPPAFRIAREPEEFIGAREPEEVICFAYGRCDQENIIEQFKNGIAALRMPTGELLANSAFLLAGQLAWCLRACP